MGGVTVPVRLACLGAGFFSQFHYRAWARMPDVALIGVCDLSEERAAAVARQYGAAASFRHVDHMLDDTRPDLLDIITPPETHLDAIRAAARAGVDVICQKPFCTGLAEAKAAIAIAAAGSISVTIHENFRFQPWHREIRRLVAGGLLGPVYQATFRLRPGDGQGPSAYLDRQPYFQTMPRFLVRETAIHFVDLFRFLFGEAYAVTALLKRLNPVVAGEDSGIFVLDMQDGVRCLFDGNRLSDHAASNRRLTMGEFLIEGEKGALSLDGDARLRFRAHGSSESQLLSYDWDDIDFGGDCVYRFQRHVVDCRLAGARVETAAEDYIANIEVEDAIYRSSAGGCRIVI